MSQIKALETRLIDLGHRIYEHISDDLIQKIHQHASNLKKGTARRDNHALSWELSQLADVLNELKTTVNERDEIQSGKLIHATNSIDTCLSSYENHHKNHRDKTDSICSIMDHIAQLIELSNHYNETRSELFNNKR